MSLAQDAFTSAYDRAALAGRIGHSAIRARMAGFDQIGKRPIIAGKARFRLRGSAIVGDRFRAEGLTAMVSITVARNAMLRIGDDVYINAGAAIEAWHEVRIGSDVLIGSFSSIIDDDRHEIEPGASMFKGPTVVGSNVWIGRGCVILPGVSIGDGSVVGANSVVTRDIPPRSFAAGTPARVIRELKVEDGWLRH